MRSHDVPAEKQGNAQAAQRDLGRDASPSRQDEAGSARASAGGAGSEGASKTPDPAGQREPHAAREQPVAQPPLRGHSGTLAQATALAARPIQVLGNSWFGYLATTNFFWLFTRRMLTGTVVR